MTREILFRGFHPGEDGDTTIYVEGGAVKGRWVEGMPYFRGNDIAFMLMPLPLEEIKEVEDEKGKKCYDIVFSFKEIIPSTVGQYTNLTDKNGKKVYVGDIINCSAGCPHSVILLQGYAGTYYGGMPAIYLSGLNQGYAWTGDEEVIGTIFDKEVAND